MPVLIKPIVVKDFNKYVDGFGNKREWKSYNTSLRVTKVQMIPAPGIKSLTFRGMVKSEFKRDPNNSTGAIKHKKLKSGVIKRDAGKKPLKEKHINYLVTVQFHTVSFQLKESTLHNQKWKISAKNIQFSKTPTISKNPVMIKCECRDFMLVFEKALAENNGLWPNNQWTRYQRLTPLSDPRYPRRNPNERMGYCKHVATFLEHLHSNKLLKN